MKVQGIESIEADRNCFKIIGFVPFNGRVIFPNNSHITYEASDEPWMLFFNMARITDEPLLPGDQISLGRFVPQSNGVVTVVSNRIIQPVNGILRFELVCEAFGY